MDNNINDSMFDSGREYLRERKAMRWSPFELGAVVGGVVFIVWALLRTYCF